MHVKAKNSWIKHLDFILADLVCFNIAFFLAFVSRIGFQNMYADREYRTLIVIGMILHFCVSFFSNHYSGILARGYLGEFKAVTFHNIKLFGLLMAYMFVVQMGDKYSRLVVISSFLMNILITYLGHITLKYIQNNRGRNVEKQKKYLVLASEDTAEEAVEQLLDGNDKSRIIIGIAIDRVDSNLKEVKGIPVVAKGVDTYEYACRNVVDGVIICFNLEDAEKIDRVTNKFLDMGVVVNVKMDMFMRNLPNVYFGHINSARVMTTSLNTVSVIDSFLKRCLDICAGLVGCLITCILFVFIAPLIKIADPKGPVFFGQERAGRNGRVFKIYKFRSMYVDAEERKKELMEDNKMDGLMFKLDADPRIIGSGPDGTRKGLGHYLRSLSLDEFPNFWSILKGDMSLVGTRPPTMDEYEKYDFHHKSRLATKPGLTGLWQVSGRSDMTDFEEIVKLDNEYIRNWSLGLDIKIILKTVWVVLTRKGSQ